MCLISPPPKAPRLVGSLFFMWWLKCMLFLAHNICEISVRRK